MQADNARPGVNMFMRVKADVHRIVVVGGGAGGIELATRLGKELAYQSSGRVRVLLIDRETSHVWKPLLHEVAAGTLDINTHRTQYIGQAGRHYFSFQHGEMIGIDREEKTVKLAEVRGKENTEFLPERIIPYDALVLAIGSETNFFGVKGAFEHAIAIDTVEEAEHFYTRLSNLYLISEQRGRSGRTTPIRIVIIGGGATGVELAAELRKGAKILAANSTSPDFSQPPIHIAIVDSKPRILSSLPENLAAAALKQLQELHVEVLPGEEVREVQEKAVLMASGKSLPSDITVWAAGIQVPKLLDAIGLKTNKMGQMLVNQSLQSESDYHIFGLGDCASCPRPETGSFVPPLAQAAHQQASAMIDILRAYLAGSKLPLFCYRDHGSLISLGTHGAVGNVKAFSSKHSVTVKGWMAKVMYLLLYRMHLLVLHGFIFTLFASMAQWMNKGKFEKLKFH